ncbi:MAG TPA: hypothetical protein VHA79_09880 [Mycobacteriales bacterium]|nr:hypothetical protein [Mycobacteriales bacterium]
MAAADQVRRRLAATIASNSYRAHPEMRSDRRRETEVPEALLDAYVAEVDPRRRLDPSERMQRVRAAYRRDVAKRQLEALRADRAASDAEAAS